MTDTTKPKYLVVDDHLVVQSTQGELKIPLRFKTRLVRAARDVKNGTGDELDQLIAILDGLGDRATIDKIDELDFLDETAPLVVEFFKAFADLQKIPLGESSASSN